MSYDLQAFPLAPGGDPEEVLEALETDVERPPTGEERDRMRRLATALVEAVPSFETGDRDDAIELSEDRFEVSVYANEAMVSIPYWLSSLAVGSGGGVGVRCTTPTSRWSWTCTGTGSSKGPTRPKATAHDAPLP